MAVTLWLIVKRNSQPTVFSLLSDIQDHIWRWTVCKGLAPNRYTWLHLKSILLTFMAWSTDRPLFDGDCYTENIYSPIVTATLCLETGSLPTLVPSSSSPAVCYVSPTSPVPAASPTPSCVDTIFSIITVTQELPLPATTLLTTTPTTPPQTLATTSLSRYAQSPATTSPSTVEPLQTPTNEPVTITKFSPAKSSVAAPSSAPASGEECTWIGHCEGMVLPSSILSYPLAI